MSVYDDARAFLNEFEEAQAEGWVVAPEDKEQADVSKALIDLVEAGEKAIDELRSAESTGLYGLRRKLDHEQANTNARTILDATLRRIREEANDADV